MYCENKNHLLDLYFLEGSDHEHSEIREHVSKCEGCREYLAGLKQTMSMLDKVDDKEPSPVLFDGILAEVSTSIPQPVMPKSGVQVVPILQIAFGQIFLFSLIYFLKIQITSMPIWKTLQNHWIVESIGSVGIAVIIALIAGTFITLSLAPILLFESKEKKSFS
ncbi:hypothetical protein C0389_05180 [bacterium]|nr:hypothetical protein [bacterium]